MRKSSTAGGKFTRRIAILFLAATALFLTGCFEGSKTESVYRTDITQSVKTKIEEKVENEVNPALGEDWLNVISAEEKSVSVSIKTSEEFFIPYVAEKLIPIVKSAVEESGAEISKLAIKYYRENNSGIVENSLAEWKTSDYETGTFSTGEKGIVKTGATVEYLKDYYKGYEDIAQKILSEESPK